MKKIILFSVTVLGLLLVSCETSKTASSSSNSSSSMLEQQWTLDHKDIKTVQPITLNFSNETNTVSGFSGCNRFSGSYEKNGNKLHFLPLAGTRMYCPDDQLEQTFMSLLNQTDSYKIDGNKLTLKKGNLDLLTFKK